MKSIINYFQKGTNSMYNSLKDVTSLKKTKVRIWKQESTGKAAIILNKNGVEIWQPLDLVAYNVLVDWEK